MLRYSIRAFLFLSLSTLLLLSMGCSKPLSDTFKSSLNDFIATGSKINAATDQGVSYLVYQDYLAEVVGAYELASASWPEGFAPEAKEQFTNAVLGWDLASVMWNRKINDAQITPGFERYAEFDSYAGEYLVKLGNNFRSTDRNIGTLLGLASQNFETGRDLILPELE